MQETSESQTLFIVAAPIAETWLLFFVLTTCGNAFQVYSLTSDFLEAAKSRYGGDRYVSYDEASARPWGLQQVSDE